MERREKDQEKDIVWKVAKFQLGELTEKGKKKAGKIQAPVTGEQVEGNTQSNLGVNGVAQPWAPGAVAPLNTQMLTPVGPMP